MFLVPNPINFVKSGGILVFNLPDKQIVYSAKEKFVAEYDENGNCIKKESLPLPENWKEEIRELLNSKEGELIYDTEEGDRPILSYRFPLERM